MAVKFASAFGPHVVLFTTSPNKTADAQRLGAHEVVVSKNEAEMQKYLREFRLHPGYGPTVKLAVVTLSSAEIKSRFRTVWHGGP